MKRSKIHPVHAGLTARIQRLIDTLLQNLQCTVTAPLTYDDAQWERLFGAKQGVVVNLLKLVQTLAVLPVEEVASTNQSNSEAQQLNLQELAILQAWAAHVKPPPKVSESCAAVE